VSQHTFTYEHEFDTEINGCTQAAMCEYEVTYEASGKNKRAKLNAPMEDCTPAEHTEIEVQEMCDQNGFDIWGQGSEKFEAKILAEAQQHYDNIEEDQENEYGPGNSDWEHDRAEQAKLDGDL
jgi:hypothetical protein